MFGAGGNSRCRESRCHSSTYYLLSLHGLYNALFHTAMYVENVNLYDKMRQFNVTAGY